MLTLKQIQKISRLLDQTGETRPGYLHDGTDNLEGCAGTEVREARTRSIPETGSPSFAIGMTSYVFDESTGDMRLILKDD